MYKDLDKRLLKIEYKILTFCGRKIMQVGIRIFDKAESVFFNMFTEKENEERRRASLDWLDKI